jgi:hypothetical protein
VAEDLAEALPTVAESPAAQSPATQSPATQLRPAARRHQALRGRFLVAYLFLGLLAGAAVAGAFVLFTQTERDKNAGFADWHPVGEKATYGQQIADHVALRYRLPSGDQIVGVVAGPPGVQTPDGPAVELAAVLIRSFNAQAESDIKTLSTDDTYLYQLCGLGTSCVVKGAATEERHRLLRREALELALYAFKYLDGVDKVIALLPPPAGGQGSPNAIFLEKGDFKTELHHPLAETIGRPDAAKLFEVPELETVRVDRLTLPFVFDYQFEALPNNTAALVLSPVKSAG